MNFSVRPLTSFALVMIIACAVHAQSNFQPARVVMSNGDTVRGSIDNRDWGRNPRKIVFRNQANEESTLSPVDVKSFFIEATREWYFGGITPIDKSSLKDDDVMIGMNQRGLITDTIFFRVLARGRLSLLLLTDENGRMHYLAAKDGNIEELRIEKRRVTKPTAGVIVIEHFKGQLSRLSSDCNGPELKPMEVAYNRKSLTEFFREYNQCVGSTMHIETKDATQVLLGIVAGIQYSSMTLDGWAYTPRYEGKYGSTATPLGGVFVDLVLPRARKSWSFYNEFMYRSFAWDELFSASQLKIHTMVRYRFPTNASWRPFVGLGVTSAFALNNTLNVCESCQKGVRTYEQGFVAEVGVINGRFRVSPRFEQSNGFSPYASTKTRAQNYYLNVAYSLSRRD